MVNAVVSEWLKVRSVKSTWCLLGVALGSVVLAAVTAWNATMVWDGLTVEQREHFMLSPLENLSTWIASLCLAVFGVLSFTSEHADGSIRTTLVALPKRWTVLAAKAVVVAIVGLLSGLLVSFGTFFISRVAIGSHPVSLQISSGPDVSHLGAMSLSIVTFSLLGLGLGSITRSIVASIVIVVALWYFVPMLAQDLPAALGEIVGSLMLGALPGQLAGSGNENSVYGAVLSPLGAAIAMMAYAVVPLGAGGVLLVWRDV